MENDKSLEQMADKVDNEKKGSISNVVKGFVFPAHLFELWHNDHRGHKFECDVGYLDCVQMEIYKSIGWGIAIGAAVSSFYR